MSKKIPQFENSEVAEVFAGFDDKVRTKLLQLRELIIKAAKKAEVGRLEETLKWGEPSYLTPETGAGSTVRISQRKVTDEYAVYFNCQTSIIEQIKNRFGKTFRYEGSRALVFHIKDKLPRAELSESLTLALTYHRRKKSHS